MNFDEYIRECKDNCIQTLLENATDAGSIYFDQAAFSRALEACERQCENIEEASFLPDAEIQTEDDYLETHFPPQPPVIHGYIHYSRAELLNSPNLAIELVCKYGTISRRPLPPLVPGLVIFNADDDFKKSRERRAIYLQQQLLNLPVPVHTMLQTTILPSTTGGSLPHRVIRLVIVTGDPDLRMSFNEEGF